MNRKRALLNLTLASALLGAIITTQIGFDRVRSTSRRTPPSVPPISVVRITDLGLHSAAGSLAWVKIVQDLLAYERAEDFVHAIKLVNALDPKFAYPYAFATLILPPAGKLDDAIEIGETGVRNAPDDWRIPHYLASTYHMYAHDRERAMLNFDRAAHTPGVPPFVPALAASYGLSTDKREQTKLIWQSIFDHADNETVRERAAGYLEHIAIIEMLEKAILRYKTLYRETPQSIDDLVSKKIIRFIPKSPLGLIFELDSSGAIRAVQPK